MMTPDATPPVLTVSQLTQAIRRAIRQGAEVSLAAGTVAGADVTTLPLSSVAAITCSEKRRSSDVE